MSKGPGVGEISRGIGEVFKLLWPSANLGEGFWQATEGFQWEGFPRRGAEIQALVCATCGYSPMTMSPRLCRVTSGPLGEGSHLSKPPPQGAM